ncbi:MAG: YbaN family protein [Clostridia bacterium]|nr:YbaN family protein [Clostridia bacterium]MBT7122791.1 YbaN family protein [Clostridia bacterium]
MKPHTKKTNILFTTLGFVSLALGIVGIVLPILPTTPFLLLASFLFYKGSNRMHDWLENNRFFGSYIKNYRKYRAIKRSAKITAIVLLWAALIVSSHLVANLYVHISLAAVGIGVTIHLLKIKTLETVLAQESADEPAESD